MKHTQRKDALRNIWKQKISWLSIVLISMLGVMAYLGINYAAAAMKQGGQAFYDKTNFKDMEMVASLLMSEEDLVEIRKVGGVEDAEGVYLTTGKIGGQNVNVQSVTKRVSIPVVTEGRLPETKNECAMERRLMEKCEVKIGDRVSVRNGAGNNAKYLLDQDFTVVGEVYHPDHVTARLPENLYVLVTEEAFDREELDNHFMKAEVRLAAAKGENTFSGRYYDTIHLVEENLSNLSEERAGARDEEIRTKAENEIKKAEDELSAGRAKLDESRATLDEMWQRLSEAKAQLEEKLLSLQAGEAELADAKAKLESSEEELRQAEKELADAEKQLAKGRASLDASRKKLEEAGAELAATYAQVQEAKEQLKTALRNASASVPELSGVNWAPREGAVDVTTNNVSASKIRITDRVTMDLSRSMDENLDVLLNAYVPEENRAAARDAVTGRSEYQNSAAKYAEAQAAATEWDRAHGEYLKKQREYQNGEAKYRASKKEYEAGQRKYEAGKKEYEDGLAQYEAGMREYEEGMAAYNAAVAEAEAKEAELNRGEEEYAEGEKEYENGKEELTVQKQKLENLDECKWFSFDRKANAAYVDLNMVSNNLSSIGMSFSLLFVLVGALVCYATIGRMVDEQRRLVGAEKALGLLNREIFAKYLLFGVSSTLTGTALGIAAAYFGLQYAILRGYSNMYVFGKADNALLILPTVAVLLFAVGLTVLSVYLACGKLLRSTAIVLMRDEQPKAKKKEGKSRKGSLYARLMISNMTSDPRRVLVTVVSVAGCCALLVIGFTLKFSVDGVTKKQFGEIVQYDKNLNFNPELSATAAKEIEGILKEAGTEYYEMYDSYITYQVTEAVEIADLMVVKDDGIQDYYALRDPKTMEELSVPKEGVLIQKRLAENYNIGPGDSLTLYDKNAKEHETTVAGVFDNYTGRAMVMSEAGYETLFGTELRNNRFLVKMMGYSEDVLRESLGSVEGFTSLARSDGSRSIFASISGILNALIAGLIVMAGMMAMFVLLNLTNMYILQKKRELTVMRINGFTVKEVKNYLSRETWVTTTIGILLGFGGGAALAYRIIRALEQPHIQMIRQISLPAWGLAGGITVLLSVSINAIALRQVKDLSLTDMES